MFHCSLHTHTNTLHRLAIPVVLVWVKGCNTWGRQDMTRVVVRYTRSTSPPNWNDTRKECLRIKRAEQPQDHSGVQFSRSPYFWSFTVHRVSRAEFFRSPTAGARGLLTSWASNPSGTTSVGTGILAVTCLAEIGAEGRGDVCGQLSERSDLFWWMVTWMVRFVLWAT